MHRDDEDDRADEHEPPARREQMAVSGDVAWEC
jgi:hypothetical protein